MDAIPARIGDEQFVKFEDNKMPELPAAALTFVVLQGHSKSKAAGEGARSTQPPI
jgi:hypothetical protein